MLFVIINKLVLSYLKQHHSPHTYIQIHTYTQTFSTGDLSLANLMVGDHSSSHQSGQGQTGKIETKADLL